MPRDAARNKPEYRPHEYIPGTHHQAWSPNDDYYQRPYKKGSGGGVFEYTIISLSTAVSGPYTGLVIASATMHGAPCDRTNVIGTVVDVVDHSGCIFDEEDMTDWTGWAAEMIFLSRDAEAACDTLTPCHFAAFNRCCGPNSDTYAEPCP